MPTLPTVSGTTPYYGGGQVQSPCNVIPTIGAPSAANLQPPGTLAVDNAAANIYGCASISGGTATWDLLAGAAMGTFTGLTGGNAGTATPNPNITVAGTANQISTSGAVHTLTLSLPAAITAPGSLTTTTSLNVGTSATIGNGFTVSAGTSHITGTTNINTSGAAVTTIGGGGTGAVHIGNATGNTQVTGSLTASTTLTATLGAITATNGNLVLGAAGNKIRIHATTAASDSVGTATLTTGTVTVSTTAVTASSLIFLTYNNCASALPCALKTANIVASTSFDIVSQDLTDSSSTVNYWIVN